MPRRCLPGKSEDRIGLPSLPPAKVDVGVDDLLLAGRNIGPGPLQMERLEPSQALQFPDRGVEVPR
jgi:hypothetical protein